MHKLGLLIPVSAAALIVVLGLTWSQSGDARTTPTASANAGKGPRVVAATPEEAGRYLVVLGGCNDCHTPGWDQTGGKIPQDQWLLGSPVGFSGPWGTTYPANVRQFMAALSEDQWVELAHRWEARPPMPAFNLHHLADDDLRAIHKFVRSLGPVGPAQPRYLSPGETPTTPYVDLMPKNLPEGAPAAH